MAANSKNWDPMFDAFNKNKNLMGSGALGEDVRFAKKKGDIELYVRGVNPECSRTALFNLFSKTGTVTKCTLLNKRPDNWGRTAFIGYKSQIEAERAIEEFNDFVFGGGKLYVTVALSEEEKRKRRAEQKMSFYTGVPEGSVNVFNSPWGDDIIRSSQEKPLEKLNGGFWGPEDDFCDDYEEGHEPVALNRKDSGVGDSTGDSDLRLNSYSSPGPVKVGCLTELFVITDLFQSPSRFPCHTKHPNAIRIHERYCDRQLSLQELKTGYLVAAPFAGEYYRAKIIGPVHPQRAVLVSFIDYGNESLVSQSDLYILDAEDQVRQSEMVEICIEGTNDTMSEEYTQKFLELMTDDGVIKINGMVVGHDMEKDVYILRMGNLSESRGNEAAVNPSGNETENSGIDDSLFEFLTYLNKNTKSTVLEASQTNLCVIRPESFEDLVSSMDELVQLYAASAAGVDLVVKDEIVLAPFEDSYYRGLVKAVDRREARVFFIDYGNEVVIPIQRLKSFGDDGIEIVAQPPLAIPCRLAGICGKHGGKFGEESYNMLVDLVSNNYVTMRGLRVVHDDEFDGDVLLVKISIGNIPCVASYLVDKGVVDKLDEDVDAIKKSKEKNFFYMNDMKVNSKLKKSNEWLNFLTLYYESPSNFTLISENGVSSLSHMSEQLESAYFNTEREVMFDENNCKTGILVVAFSRRYQMFLRSVVRTVYTEDQAADTYFIDFGDVEKIPFHNLFSMKKEFMKKPQLSIPCCLEDALVKACSNDFSKELSDIFISENPAMRKIKIKIIGLKESDDPCDVPVKAVTKMQICDGFGEFLDVDEEAIRPTSGSRKPKTSSGAKHSSKKMSSIKEDQCQHPELVDRLKSMETSIDELNKKIGVFQEALKIVYFS